MLSSWQRFWGAQSGELVRLRRGIHREASRLSSQLHTRLLVWSTILLECEVQILQVLESAAQPLIQAFLEKDRDKWIKDPSRELAWQLYGDGMSQREIANRCGHQQGWVSRLLKEGKRSHAIALDAATDLIRQPAFQSLAMDPNGSERLVDALQNHLVTSEQEGDVAPLRRWMYISRTASL